MTIEETLSGCLLAWLPLANMKVRAEVAQPTDVTPYIVYTQVSGVRIKSLTGDSGLSNPRFQIDVYADTKAQSTALKSAIREAVLSCQPLGAVLVGESSGYEPDTKRYRHQQDFSFWFYD